MVKQESYRVENRASSRSKARKALVGICDAKRMRNGERVQSEIKLRKSHTHFH